MRDSARQTRDRQDRTARIALFIAGIIAYRGGRAQGSEPKINVEEVEERENDTLEEPRGETPRSGGELGFIGAGEVLGGGIIIGPVFFMRQIETAGNAVARTVEDVAGNAPRKKRPLDFEDGQTRLVHIPTDYPLTNEKTQGLGYEFGLLDNEKNELAALGGMT